MRAVTYSRFGGPEVLELSDVAKPTPGPNMALLKMAGAGINPVDCKLRSGALDGIFPLEFPVTPGWDVSGTVVDVGVGVDESWVGVPVFAYVRSDVVHEGTYSEYVCVPADFLARCPTTLDLAEAAAVPLVALTAYQSLVEFAQVTAGQKVLIHASAGAVGQYAVQMAHAAGAHVVGTAKLADQATVSALGADQLINYRDADWAAQAKAHAPGGYDVILDGVGGATLTASYDLLAHGGALVSLNDPPEEGALGDKSARLHRLFSMPNGEHLTAVATLISEGKLKPLHVDVLPLDQASEGHRRQEAGNLKGKIVLAA